MERPFAAFTEQNGEWWQPNGLFQFTEGRTGTLAFTTAARNHPGSPPTSAGES